MVPGPWLLKYNDIAQEAKVGGYNRAYQMHFIKQLWIEEHGSISILTTGQWADQKTNNLTQI